MNTTFIPGFVSLGRSQSKGTKTLPRYQKSSAIKELERLTLEAKRLKYPCNSYLVGDTFRDDSANSLTKAVIAHIKLNGYTAERIANMGRVIDRTKKVSDVLGRTRLIGSVDYIPGSGTNGTPDVHACIKGRFIGIEIKYGSDRQSPSQKEYQKAVESAGGLYFIARNFTDFKNWFDKL